MSSKINLQPCEYARKSSIFQDNQLIYNKIVTFSHFFLVVLLFISDIPYIPPYAAVYWRFPRALWSAD